ncbi:DUF732 domain-containing protein [Streptomyces sp. NPDC047974]|uniref:DUF732 domain-containing protein n=1 Tax=Streptomyces sp. NPDC047974 TaxID=3154343 RepID=UPI00340F6139
MRIRTTTSAAAAAVAVLAVTLVGCVGEGDGHKPTTVEVASPTSAPTATGTADTGAGATNAGLPPEPTGARRDALLAAIRDVDGGLARDEEKAIDAARSQCAALDGGAADPERSAARRFDYDGVTLTDEDASHLNIALRRTLCPES